MTLIWLENLAKKITATTDFVAENISDVCSGGHVDVETLEELGRCIDSCLVDAKCSIDVVVNHLRVADSMLHNNK